MTDEKLQQELNESRVQIELLRDILAVLIDKAHPHGYDGLLKRLYYADDPRTVRHFLNNSYNTLDIS